MLTRLRLSMRGDGGFTLIELIVVVIVIAVLAAIAVPLYVGHIKHARTAEGSARLGSIMTASKTYYNRYNHWPNTPGEEGYYADFDPTEHFSYSIVRGGGGTEAFAIRAEGLPIHGMGGITITMACVSPKAEGVISISGI
jgi:prepilin-type N-terminal cleavage/methylation domain-containing protein